MPGPRNKPKNKKKKSNKTQVATPPSVPAPATCTKSSPPQPTNNHVSRDISTPIIDSGTGPRVRDLYAFLASPFAAPPTLDDLVCEWFLDSTTYAILEQLLPQELSLVSYYSLKGRYTCRSETYDRFCSITVRASLIESAPRAGGFTDSETFCHSLRLSPGP